MINMIRADLYRIVRSVGFYISIAVMLLMIGLSVYTVQPGTIGVVYSTPSDSEYAIELTEDMTKLSISEFREMAINSTNNYKLDKAILGVNMNLYYVFIFIAAILISVDFAAGSVKNTLSSAISRRRYFASKTLLVMGVTVLLFFLNTYAIYFMNLIFNGSNLSSSLGKMTKISLIQLPVILALAAMLSGIAFMVKKTSLFNVAAIPLIILCQTLLVIAGKIFSVHPDKLFKYELQSMLSNLIYSHSDSYKLNCYIICAVIIVVFTSLGWLSFRKHEIK